MAFNDVFTGTDGDLISDRSGWTLITDGGTTLDIRSNAVGLIAGGGSGMTAMRCTDQGSADHYTQVKTIHYGTSGTGLYAVVRLVDKDNWVGYRLFGTGSAGRRLTKCVAGTITDLSTSQPVSGEWIRVEAEGTTYRMYEGGTGATPGTWNQIGTDQTVADGDISTSETSQGLTNNGVTISTISFHDELEAGALAGGGWSVTDVDLDESISDGQTGVVVTVTGTVAATGKLVFLEQGGTFVEQTVTGETAQTITITVNYGALTSGAASLYVRNPL